ncbi:helix-turn-helix domain-containing protein [Spirosoma montaniterrae]|nr:helix-turn-helix transcriptional regulator [Spirosoma montaniterrae]
MLTLLENIRQLRLHKNFKQEYMAEQLGISTATYSKIENGKIKLSTERLHRIAATLGLASTPLTIAQLNTYQNGSNQSEISNLKHQITKLEHERTQAIEREKSLLAYIRVLETTAP